MEAVILAAGKGTRMFSDRPKVLHDIGGRPMLEHVVNAARQAKASHIHVVVGFGAEQVQQQFTSANDISWVLQEQQLGTGHAVQCALPGIDTDDADNRLLVLYGDVPLIRPVTLTALMERANSDTIALLTLETDNPAGLGRIIRDERSNVTAIIEEKDASAEQKQIQEINSGIMVLPAARLQQWLENIGNNNSQGEYYLTDVIAMAKQQGCVIDAMVTTDDNEVQGVNDKRQLAQLERRYQMNRAEELLTQGVTLRDPARVDIRGELHCGSDVVIDANVIIEGEVTLGDGVQVQSNVIIRDATIGKGTTILAGSNIEGADIGESVAIGPSARIRPGTQLANDVKIGNFVEVKNAKIGKGSKANHLAYIGDAEIGQECNIGAGTVFCNYDGANKHKTTLGDNVFIGSNSVLVAPVSLADNSFVAAGSAINTDVSAGNLAVARTKQRNIAGWKRPTKKD